MDVGRRPRKRNKDKDKFSHLECPKKEAKAKLKGP